MKKSISLVLISILLFSLVVGCSAQTSTAENNGKSTQSQVKSDKVLKVGLTTAETHSCNKSFEKFKEVLGDLSGGTIKVEIYPNSQLGNDTDSVGDVQLGNISMTNISSAIVSQFVPSLAVFDLPFLFNDRNDLQAMYDSEDIGGKLNKDMESAGFKCLGLWDAGYRHLTNSKKEITNPSDLSGMKIRTMSSNYHIRAWELYGASPTPISFTELFTALQQKTVDGQENPYGLIVSQKFYEVQPYLSTTGHILTVTPLIMNKDLYDSLTAQEQEWVNKAAIESTAYNREIATQEEVDSKNTIIDLGVKVYEMSEAERLEFRKLALPVYEEMKASVDSKLIDAIINFGK